ncbi:hypothetical protein L6452_42315 [Arctium lappa]|uniref:Uncharacterized protein n=1 Tax=Arctium lappa TaxID=4217 RepID=A0ACB8XHG0_ARCLA|nr:hypothetical protein L6452_42315 [Arctium lappa]
MLKNSQQSPQSNDKFVIIGRWVVRRFVGLLGAYGCTRDVEAFQCKHGNVYLFSKVVNVTVGAKEDRLMMMIGLHTVVNIFCVKCGSIETAHEKNQKYKEGKSVLERFKLSGPDGSNYWVSHEAHIGGSDQDD